MKNYLVVATKNCGGTWNAHLVCKEVDINTYNTFSNMIVGTLTKLDLSNVATIEKGYLLFTDSEYNSNLNDVRDILRTYIGIRVCDNCGAFILPQDIRTGASAYRNSKRYCPTCTTVYINSNLELDLDGYHDTEDDVRVINAIGENFTLNNVKGMGFEAEYYNGVTHEEHIKCTKAFYDIAKYGAVNRMFRCEQDCTVSGEIISNVFTKKAFENFDCSIITDVMKLNGNIPNNHHAGLHVHLSRGILGDTPKEQCLNFLKLQYFMKSYENDFLKLCGRQREYMEYCKFFSFAEIEGMKQNILVRENPWSWMPNSHGGGRGCALNVSGDTFEFRIGANTNDPVRFKNFILFIWGISENIKNVPFEKCYCIGKVTKLVPNEVMNYWRKNGCFLNTNAIETRGVSINA